MRRELFDAYRSQFQFHQPILCNYLFTDHSLATSSPSKHSHSIRCPYRSTVSHKQDRRSIRLEGNHRDLSYSDLHAISHRNFYFQRKRRTANSLTSTNKRLIRVVVKRDGSNRSAEHDKREDWEFHSIKRLTECYET